jgi:hypothetical protein
MKVVITGHGSGIGKVLKNKFDEQGFSVSGYDIFDGKDVTKKDIVDEIILDCSDAEVFVNNAFPNQSYILNRVHEAWRHQNKTIINMSSSIVNILNGYVLPPNLLEYYKEKQELERQVKLNRGYSSLPYIMNVRPSWFQGRRSYWAGRTHKLIDLESMADLIMSLYGISDKLKVLDIEISP